MVARRIVVDRQGDAPMEYALASLIEDGELARHLRRARNTYRERQQVFAAALRHELGDRVRFDIPAGGLAMWAELVAGDAVEWARRCARGRVSFEAGTHFHFAGAPVPCARLGFAGLDVAELERAATVLGRCLPPRLG